MSDYYDYSLTSPSTPLVDNWWKPNNQPVQSALPSSWDTGNQSTSNLSVNQPSQQTNYGLGSTGYNSPSFNPFSSGEAGLRPNSNTLSSYFTNNSIAPTIPSYQVPTTPQPSEFVGPENLPFGNYEHSEDNGFLSKLRNMSFPQVSQGQADLFKGLAGLYSAYQGRKQADQLRQAAQQQDPFGAQRPFYQQQLQQTYSNPNAYMSSPEAQLQNQAFKQQLERLDAKSGRRSQYGARAIQLAQLQAKQLADYRAALQQPAGSGIAPSGAGMLQSQAAQAEMTAGGAPFQALQDIFTGQTPQYRTQAAENKKLRESIALLTK